MTFLYLIYGMFLVVCGLCAPIWFGNTWYMFLFEMGILTAMLSPALILGTRPKRERERK